VYIPLQVMPEGVRTVSEYTPAGAAVQSLAGAWAGSGPDTSSLIVMATYAVVTVVLAAWWFRWE
ncbi:MAG TPA: ABC transporter permease, partial [Acidimicrobiia bacterium]|nr:ABC transporter permease [Acidimicrobiia bacterium]